MPQSGGLAPQHLADLCLGYLAEDPEQLAAFMAASGYSPAALMAARGSAPLQAGLIDYFAQNESLLLALCANNGVQPEHFMSIWAQLNPSD